MEQPSLGHWPTQDWLDRPPGELGVDPAGLSAIQCHIEDELPHFRSLLVVRHGYLVYERYFQREYGPDDCHELASAVKSFVSALVGVALHVGILHSLDQRLVEFYPEHVSPDTDPVLHEITLRHLLTMTSGLVMPSREETDKAARGDDWIGFVCGLRVSPRPGQRFEYKPDSLTLSHVLARASGVSVPEFARDHLFAPLGISRWKWAPDNRAALRPRDMAKLGLLYLNEGTWEGSQIVPAGFVEQSTRVQVEGGFPEQRGYGYLWWIAGDRYASFAASGVGGQYIYVVPGLDAVVVTTSDLDRPHLENRSLIEERVIPAMAGAAA